MVAIALIKGTEKQKPLNKQKRQSLANYKEKEIA